MTETVSTYFPDLQHLC